jgi:asparagine synthetase B (glutamine-hydrolysing)
MCGIFASVSRERARDPSPGLLELLCNRGPDLTGKVEVRKDLDNGNTASLLFTSTVLALRGGHIAAQPLECPDSGSVLCWNGEAWKIGDEAVEGNDGEAILRLLSAVPSCTSDVDSINSVLKVIKSISGPFAFVYYDQPHGLIYFGRDCLGRRSLLYSCDETSKTIEFASIAASTSDPWYEVEADGMYILALAEKNLTSSLNFLQSPQILGSPYPIYNVPWVQNNNDLAAVAVSLI